MGHVEQNSTAYQITNDCHTICGNTSCVTQY